MLGRPEAPAALQRVAATAATANEPGGPRARRAGAARARSGPRIERRLPRRRPRVAPRDAAIQHGVGRARALETYKNGEALKSFQHGAAQSIPRYVPALIGSARALSDDNPPEAIAACARRPSTINPSSVDAHVFLASKALDAGKRDEAGRGCSSKRSTSNPSSLEARSLFAGIAYVEDRKADFEAEVARGAGDRPEVRRGLPRRRRTGGAATTASTKRWR